MNKLDLLAKRNDLAQSAEYQQIKRFVLEEIVRLSGSTVEPLLIKGMLQVIKFVDGWQDDFNNAKKG